MVDQSIINTAKEYIKTLPINMDFKKAYLFGSYAKGSQTESSDIDLAIVLGKMDDFFEVQIQLMRLRRTINLRIEPHPFLESDFNLQNPFAFEISQTGIEIS